MIRKRLERVFINFRMREIIDRIKCLNDV